MMTRTKLRQIQLSEQGFTLIEVLIGLALLGIMMVLIFSVLRTGARSWEGGEKRTTQSSQMLIVSNFLRTRLTETRALFDDFSEDERLFAFQGSEDELRMVSALPASTGRGGLRLFTLAIAKDGRQKNLSIALKRFYPSFDDVEEEIEDVVVVENIEKIQLSYFGSDDPGDDPDWQKDWEEKQTLPFMVKIEIQLKNQEPWPEIIVTPKITPAVRRFEAVNG